ncbi:MAG: HD domain-containing protein [Promethearchaeota archaeon]
MQSRKIRETLEKTGLLNILIKVFNAMGNIKLLKRQGWVDNGLPPDKVETVGAHTFGTCFLILILEELGDIPKQLKFDKLIKYALIHDIGESITGDFTPYNSPSKSDRIKQELDAANELFPKNSKLSKLNNFYTSFIKDELDCEDREYISYVKQVDKLDMMIQALYYEITQKTSLKEFHENPLKYLSDGTLINLFKNVKKDIFKKKE